MVFFPSNYSGFQLVGNNINLLVLFILNNNNIFPNRIPTKTTTHFTIQCWLWRKYHSY